MPSAEHLFANVLRYISLVDNQGNRETPYAWLNIGIFVQWVKSCEVLTTSIKPWHRQGCEEQLANCYFVTGRHERQIH